MVLWCHFKSKLNMYINMWSYPKDIVINIQAYFILRRYLFNQFILTGLLKMCFHISMFFFLCFTQKLWLCL